MAATKQKSAPKKAGSSRLVKVAILAVAVLVGWQLWTMQEKLALAQTEHDRIAQAVEELKAENEVLAADVAEGTTPEKLEEIARKELGLVTPGEYVFPHTGQ